MVTVSDAGSITNSLLFDLLTSRIWTQVSVIGVRQQPVSSLRLERFENEVRLLEMIQNAFEAHSELEFQSLTVSIADLEGLVREAFSPYWKMHILHEPVVRIDQLVASQPMWAEDRHLLVILLALTVSGGFVWQPGALGPNMADKVVGVQRSVRIGRVYLRVVNAGRLTDEVLAGAFPKSGPWSIPTDVPNALAVPPGTPVTDALLKALVKRGKFSYRPWEDPKREKPKNLNIWEGLKLFAKEFGAALKGIPVSLVEKIKGDIENFVQKTTFGEGAAILLKFNPRTDDLNSSDLVEVIKSLQLGNSVDPIGDPEPWDVLQRVSLGVVDGGRFPEGIAPPVSGSNRLVYTDPVSIGPAPDDAPFHVTPFEIELLKLGETQREIGAMSVADALTLKTHLDAMREELAVKPPEIVDKKAAQKSASQKSPTGAVPTNKKVGRLKRWRLRRKERKAAKKAARSAAKLAKKNRKSPPAQPAAVTSPTPTTSAGEVLTGAAASAAVVLPTASDQPPANAQPSEPPKIAEHDETNRHSPSHPDFDPREYTPIGVFYQGDRSEVLAEYADSNKICEAAQASYASVNGRYAKNKSCDHCGTAFDHGLMYLHEPTKKLVRVGNICARKSLPVPGDSDLVAIRLTDLERRFGEWLTKRSASLLWRVGDAIVTSLVGARKDLARCLEILATRPAADLESTPERIKFAKWSRRGLLSVVLVIAAALASIVFTPFPLLIAVLIVMMYFSGFIIRMLYLARDIVQAQYKFRLAMDEYERAYSRARHDVEEVVRLSSVSDQFNDWQVVIRELVHLPFGKEIGFATAKVGIEEVTRPPAMVLGKSRPDEKQRMQLFLQARRQTIHGGWLLEILDILKQEWRADYENSRLTTPADNILPESDNSPAASVVGKKPLSDEDVYYPRSDFRRRVIAGDLQRALVAQKAQQISLNLSQTALNQLLAKVEVRGLGSALSGQSVETFLTGLSEDSDNTVGFPPDLISDKYPSHRIFGPELVLPPAGWLTATSSQMQVQPGAELTVAAWRVELSAEIETLDILKGFQPPTTAVDPDQSGKQQDSNLF